MGEGKIYLALEKADIAIDKGGKDDLLSDPVSVSEREWDQVRKTTTLEVVKEKKNRVGQRLSTVFNTDFVAAEQFRKLRTHIIRMDSVNSIKTIMVTSAIQGEGKSFVATNLAIGFAQDLHLHSLLVDCDLRNPTLGPKFGVESKRGVSDYLLGHEDISAFLLNTNLNKLSLLTSGSIQGNPSELMSSKKMASLVRELKSRYTDRYIIFDSTPLLATSEAEVLAKLVDGIVVVVRAGLTPRETVEQAMNLLGKEKILGVVLNDLQFKSSGLFSRYFGSNGYYYGYGVDKKRTQPQNRWTGMFRSKGKNF